jgi:hypothetical protein
MIKFWLGWPVLLGSAVGMLELVFAVSDAGYWMLETVMPVLFGAADVIRNT